MTPSRTLPVRARLTRRARRLLATVATLAAATTGLALASGAPAQASGGAPGDFLGRAFDQCNAPSQSSMTAWMNASPFRGVGIYISGDSRACRKQANLTPTWISNQIAAGWHLLPITLGPQASCSARDRYLRQVRIDPRPAGTYANARAQGAAEARKTIARAVQLGIPKGSTMYYDLEAFDTRRSTACTDSARYFVSAWTTQLQAQGWKSGFYSSGGSGIKMLDAARTATPGKFTMPDQLWIADWNGQASTASSYVRSDGWTPHRRIHQYRGGHNETYGGVTINIDSNYADLGRGAFVAKEPAHAGGVSWNPTSYAALTPRTRNPAQVKLLQSLLASQGFYKGTVTGTWNPTLTTAVKAFRKQYGWAQYAGWNHTTWMALLSRGATPVVKYGSTGTEVRRVQRALNATGTTRKVAVTGVLSAQNVLAVQDYQRRLRLPANGIVEARTWYALTRGRA